MGLVALPQGIFYGPAMECNRESTTMAVVAQPDDDADRILPTNDHQWSAVQLLSDSPERSGLLFLKLKTTGDIIGAIPLRGSAMYATGHRQAPPV